MTTSTPRSDARRRGRRVVMTAYYVVVGAFAVYSTVNITKQVFASGSAGDAARPPRCVPALRGLAVAVDRARNAASLSSGSGEDAAIGAFRTSLLPEWAERDAIARSCEGDPKLVTSLDTIERLRYAEERAVRREVVDLAPLRQRVRQMLASELHENE